MMSFDDPWRDIRFPTDAQINGRRVDPGAPWDLFWGVDGERHRLLVLQHSGDTLPPRRLPTLRGLRVETTEAAGGGQILIRLLDSEQREVFYRFCTDIVRATNLAETESEAVARFLGRTWRWHRLLRSGRDTRLTDEEQRGLIGELHFIETHLLPKLGPMAAVRCWTGPLDAPRDFEIATVHVEAKTRGTQRNVVTISSAQQLDSAGCDRLFLHVTEIVAAREADEEGVTVADVARQVSAAIEKRDPRALEIFEERLLASGLDSEHDYSDRTWLVVGEILFEVTGGFPRIAQAALPPGVEQVRYALALDTCQPYRIDFAALDAALREDSDGD